MRSPYQLIDRIQFTEKGTRMTETENKYLFRVAMDANKVEIKKAIEDLFGVHVLKVNTMVRKGKRKRERTVRFGKQADWKRAIVTLAEGETIDVM